VIQAINPADVKCCGATTLAQKAHNGDGLTIEELQRRVDNQCIASGFETVFHTKFEGTPNPLKLGDAAEEQKWRVCQSFKALNDVTKVAPMPQGNIHTKQQCLSGHRWVHTFDFALGFYACAIREEDQPYICFYIEGRRYFCYKWMPFGLTGAPSTFANMTAAELGDLVGNLFLFVDDGGMAGDDFGDSLADLRTLFTRCRESKLTLSAAKSKFFVTEVMFTGRRVGPDGIKPDLTNSQQSWIGKHRAICRIWVHFWG
jgi:hypothetical protein